MQQLRTHFRTSIENKLAPFLKKYGFDYLVTRHELSETHDVFQFRRNSSYIYIAHMGYNPVDSPYSFVPILGKENFKKTTKLFDNVPLWYFKQKIAPVYEHQRVAIKMNLDTYHINTLEEITISMRQAIFDLDNFCKDFLLEDFLRFNKVREIKYLEYLVQTQVDTETDWLGLQKIVMKSNEEFE